MVTNAHPDGGPLSIAMNDISSLYRSINTTRDAKELAAMLLHPERERPAVVVSTTKNGPLIRPADLAKRLGPDADVYLLGSASLAYDFQDAMPWDTSVYGGAARCYPPGNSWANNTAKSMVRLAYTEEEGRAAISLLADDVAAMEALVPVKVTTTSAPRPTVSAAVEGTVSVILEPDGVLIKLEDGIARIDTSLLAPGISPQRLFSPSQKVTGTVRDGIFTITEGLHTPGDAADHAARGTVQPALVTSHKTVALFPGLSVRHANDEPVGSVIAVHIELSGRADGKAWKLGTVTDPDEITDALPFVIGGDPWIRWEPSPSAPPAAEPTGAAGIQAPDTAERQDAVDPADIDPFTALDAVRSRLEHLSAENARLSGELEALLLDSVAETDAAPLPSPALGGAELERLRSQVALLTRERVDMLRDHRRAMSDADELAAENARMAHTIERLREDVRKERARADRARQMARDIDDVADTGPLFSDPEDQFRHEIYLEWATRIPAGSKSDSPLADYGFAEGFLASVEEIQGIDRSKIVAVAVEVLTGLADALPGRDMHRLRGGISGTSSFVEDPELGTAWRVALQVKTASARRMHFWRGTDGRIVFATVGLHDDMDI
ncbi:hypothetical protein Achl_4348 (plasmid) [Pseudarthrobacter chlorophenolicus A6]|uniref:Uncharacterized protein n=1 Tax=Pseudarthrobacter chlorophenolicus (strain ATCC 700700 / DSM 12829 / CIP 107037 / JCM 12360 / KCTC 9906 / NCIMB 13794 / A6) TaxID=452863 RepID=B8HIQ2_PSECP|nr:hypothetical protein [Pseudarthrobacter chlorophenolicus]ACL42299.1 hypothetical protein Achl_4348 [Pseudarthrobacter chlorophenolicus A6]SDQ16177.1 hypothetical protein SAMN04489738_0405 [Pseudarthrobacter chlorophenolicus]